ncbi:hypothetical protein ACWHLZ_27950 [Streptomyces chartreusis]|uniref:hypothetical protein n=1 Tax=Streptomyces chartreusis TaxID=1969 RepID=UPI00343117C6
MSYPTIFATPGLRQLAEEVDAERQAQLAKWGVQLHPVIDARDIDIVTHHYYAGRADIWRQVNEERATASLTVGRCSRCPEGPHTHTAWDGVLLEEVYEALGEADPVKRRIELVQVMAVCAAMIAADESRGVDDSAAAAPELAHPASNPQVSAPNEVDEKTTRVLAALHRSAEEDVTRVISLYERWVKAGAPPLGTPVSRWWDARLVELREAIRPPDEEPALGAESLVDVKRLVDEDGEPLCTCTYGERCPNCRD